jgi:hypothetical protein
MHTNSNEASNTTDKSTLVDASAAKETTSYSLDGLARLSLDQVEALYCEATVPSSVRAVDGALKGRMLAVQGLPKMIQEPLRRWAASRSFVWEGKTFVSSSEHHGAGHNRVYIPKVFGRQNLFPFDTLTGPSAIDEQPTLILDYNLDVNPGYIRHIHAELREVEPGLFLGPAMWKNGDKKTLVLWFALDARLS